ncbi:MAG: DUF2845 domain-containing protein [Steroidobacteraceae bacterium]
MPRLVPLLLTLAAVVASTTPAFADAMRCGSRLVSEGETRDAVAAKCGEPADVQTRTILRRPYYDFHGRIVYYGDGLVEVPVEIWTYNFGPYKLMRRVRFVDGLVDEIETLSHGYREKDGNVEKEKDY